MKSVSVLAIAPYDGLSNFFINCAKSFPSIRLNVFTGNLQVALQNLQNYRDYDVVISRGGTAQILREKLLTPVIEVEVSVYDMIRVIKMAQKTGKSFAIVGFPNTIRSSRIICEILQYDMPAFIINSEEDASYIMKELAKKGIELVIGDVITTDVARAVGIDSLLITSGFESVEKAFRDTLQLFQNMDKLRRATPYKEVLDCAPYKIALFDSQKRLIYANSAFTTQKPDELEVLLKKYIPRLDAGPAVSRFHRRHGNLNLDIFGIRLDDANIHRYAFYIASYASASERETCIRIESADYVQQIITAPMVLGAEKARAVIEKVALCGKSQTPILILGEIGTGAERFALYVHSSGVFKNSLFITVNCSILNEKSWQNIVNHVDSPIHDLRCTIFLHNVHTLAYGVQKLLNNYMEDTLLTKRHHVISSTTVNLIPLVSQNQFLPALYQKLNGLTIHLPSLNECPEEIPALASLYISRYNMEFTKQVIGFEDEALQYLKSYHWEGNLEQFQDVIRQLMISADNSYISLSDVQAILVKICARYINLPHIDLSKTFVEIERDIINYVLAEEGMNQSRAAKRLGIGRSTLWRKMAIITN